MQEILVQHIRLGHDAGGRNVCIFFVSIGNWSGRDARTQVPLKISHFPLKV